MTGVLAGNAVSSLIVAMDSSKVQLTDAEVVLNMGFSGTGVLMAGASTLHLVRSILSRNFAVTYGGAVAAGSGTIVEIVDSRFDSNIAAGGGALFVSGLYKRRHVYRVEPNEDLTIITTTSPGSTRSANVEVVNTSFIGNCAVGGTPLADFGRSVGLYSSVGRGGAVWAVGSNLTMTANTTFEYNVAAAGGAVSSVKGGLVLGGILLRNNQATYDGALLVWRGMAHIVHGTNFTNNTAQVWCILVLHHPHTNPLLPLKES